MNGITINKKKEKKEVQTWLGNKLIAQSREIMKKKREDWKNRKEISRNGHN